MLSSVSLRDPSEKIFLRVYSVTLNIRANVASMFQLRARLTALRTIEEMR